MPEQDTQPLTLSLKAQRKISQILKPILEESHEPYAYIRETCAPASNITSETLNRHIPSLMAAFFHNDSIHAMEGERLPTFLSNLVPVIESRSFSRWLIRIGLGGSDVPPAPRVVVSILPVLLICKQLHQAQFSPPRIEIFKANNAGININGLDRQRAMEISRITLLFLNCFVEHYFPELRPYIRFLQDRSDTFSTLRDLHGRAILPKCPRDDVIIQMGARRNTSPDDAMLYAILHAFQLGCLHPHELSYESLFSPVYVNDSNVKWPTPVQVVPFGGFPERHFLRVVNSVLECAPEEDYCYFDKMHIITRLGKMPPYFPADEPVLGDRRLIEFRIEDMPKNIQHDYHYLFSITAQVEFERFVAEFVREHM